MNNYIQEIIGICKLPFNEVLKDFKLIQIAGKAVYISNYIKIIDYNTQSLALKVKDNILTISGKNLIISQINKKEIVISGTISSCILGDKNENSK